MSSNCVQNAFFQLSPSGRNEKTPLGSNFTISISCHHFGWAFPSSGKRRLYERRPIAFKTRFFNFQHRGETKKHPWDRILQFRLHGTILGGLIQAAEKAGLTKVVQLRSKRVFLTFPIEAKRENTLGFEFYNFGFMRPFWVGVSKQRKSRIDKGGPIAFKTRFFNFPHRGETKKHPWDRILQFRFPATILGGLFQAVEKAGFTKVVQLRSKRVFSTFPIGEKRENTLGIQFYNFGFIPPFWVGFCKQLKKPGLRRSSNCVQNAFFQLSPSGRNEKHSWDRILQFRFHATILGRLFQAAEKAGFTKVVQLRSKRLFSPCPIGAKRENTLGIEFYNFGFMPPFWVGFSKERKKPGLRRSFNCVQNGFFFKFSHRGETKKHPWDRILQFRFHATILGELLQAAEKALLTKVFQLRSKRVFSTFPIGAKRKNTLGIEF